MTEHVLGGPAVGATFAGYRLEERLGRGGMGVVYLARDERLDRPVALKLIAPTLSVDPGFRERFLTESRLAASLDHSHVIPIYEAGEADGELYLAMRYVEGTTLRDLLHQAGPLEPARVLDLCEQVAEALDAAHARDLVHRDVKPGNVLIADEGGRDHCYLCDFGIAQHGGKRDEQGGISGTVAYYAPEQISGSADRRSCGSVRPRLRPLRMPHRPAPLHGRLRHSDPLCTPARSAAVAPRAPE